MSDAWYILALSVVVLGFGVIAITIDHSDRISTLENQLSAMNQTINTNTTNHSIDRTQDKVSC